MAGMSKKEQQAWEFLLGDIRHARRTYRHLMERAQREPEKVRVYLSTLGKWRFCEMACWENCGRSSQVRTPIGIGTRSRHERQV